MVDLDDQKRENQAGNWNESVTHESEGSSTDSEDAEEHNASHISDDELGPEDGERSVADEQFLGFAID